jgi:hypothetical protein
MTISPTNIFAYGDSGQSLSRMKYDELHKVRYNYDNGWVIGCFNACDGLFCGIIPKIGGNGLLFFCPKPQTAGCLVESNPKNG